MLVTVFTPVYNRESTLSELYSSLLAQTFKDFEWIIVNDGSTDGVETLVNKWVSEGKILIQYISQSNNGKHIAMNKAVKAAKGMLFTTVDSDDRVLPEGLQILVDEWKMIPENKWNCFASVKANCVDLKTGKRLGPVFKDGKLVSNYLDARYIHKINYEMQSLTRTDVLKEFPNPEIIGGYENGGLRFFPETIWQDLAAEKYLTIFIDKCTCAYRTDSSDSILGRGKKYNRYRENIYLWSHIINNNAKYFFYRPFEFIKSYVGMSMDGFFNGYNIHDVLSMINGLGNKIAVFLFYPVGWVCYLYRK